MKEKKITILIAEDEEYNMMYLLELFSSTNIHILEASNGQVAVEMAEKHNEINLILMDIKMPILNGYEAMNAIKKLRPNIPIIVLSAFAMKSEKQAALNKGFDSYLTKPINKKLLFEKIKEFTN